MDDLGLLGTPQATAAPTAIPQMGPAIAAGELLDDDEIIQFSTKPSLWFVGIASLPVGGPAFAVGLAAWLMKPESGDWRGAAEAAMQLAFLIAIVRVILALTQWASRLYVLTNRRVMSFRGVIGVRVEQIRLSRIADAVLVQGGLERPLRLGRICMVPKSGTAAQIEWGCVARADEVHEIVMRAISRDR